MLLLPTSAGCSRDASCSAALSPSTPSESALAGDTGDIRSPWCPDDVTMLQLVHCSHQSNDCNGVVPVLFDLLKAVLLLGYIQSFTPFIFFLVQLI